MIDEVSAADRFPNTSKIVKRTNLSMA